MSRYSYLIFNNKNNLLGGALSIANKDSIYLGNSAITILDLDGELYKILQKCLTYIY